MFNFRSLGYRSLPQDEARGLPGGREKSGAPRTYRHSPVFYCIVEAIIFLVGFAAFEYWRSPVPACGLSTPAAQYYDLNRYNTTQMYTEDGTEFMANTPEGEEFWQKVLDNHGIVSVPTEWAQSLDLPRTQPHPEIPDHSIYQIDVFHSLHCLYRIRTQLVSNETTNLWISQEHPNGEGPDNHTLHCIDYIRQSLICHADITLQGTEDFLHYSENSGHQCKDYGAIMNWVHKNLWMDHHIWLYKHYGLGGHNEVTGAHDAHDAHDAHEG
ncbi:hypothetical protein GQ53DRAFT_880091 [Thozetella sp. PMI_491]|nr:hypothetical protein GQ53DRAFT_880091 [Thozetella sp. PMI_491]